MVRSNSSSKSVATDMKSSKTSKAWPIAADFLAHTVIAFVIGLATSVLLAGAVLLLAQASTRDQAAPSDALPAIHKDAS
jgi:hypothetical protein